MTGISSLLTLYPLATVAVTVCLLIAIGIDFAKSLAEMSWTKFWLEAIAMAAMFGGLALWFLQVAD
jgi:uncharacterized membrane-anchored protein YjiN (DUF445 family)